MGPDLVVLTDFSESSRRALAYAAALAQPLQSRVVLLHLYQDVLLDPEYVVIPAGAAIRSQRETRRALEKMAEELPVPATVDLSVNTLAEALADAIARYHPLVLVCGRAATPDFLDQLLGDQSLPVLRHLHYPLLMVPENAHLPGSPTRVGLVADGEPFKLRDNALNMQPLWEALGAKYFVLHVETEEQYDRARTAVNSLRHNHLVKDLPPDSLYTVHHTRPATGILQAAADTQTELLVLLARERSLLGGLFHRSITAQVLQRSPVPVLVLPVI
ncbi:universal stress protein [Hymenobacter sp. BT730]|uniref:universal stress protein n=1 Tax=Hymenobacter sp. BT730 TaxID=3063332 RepID=UPI0026DF1011|nr:universal stress protein [Hymenobacter sp. BT730]